MLAIIFINPAKGILLVCKDYRLPDLPSGNAIAIAET